MRGSESSPIASISDAQDQVIREMGGKGNWFEKYQYLIDLGRNHPSLDAAFRTDRYAVHGCQSRVWIHARLDQGRLRVRADSDSLITKGIIALLVRVFDGQTPEDAATTDLYFIREVGLDQHLSPSRANGLASMMRQLKAIAENYRTP